MVHTCLQLVHTQRLLSMAMFNGTPRLNNSLQCSRISIARMTLSQMLKCPLKSMWIKNILNLKQNISQYKLKIYIINVNQQYFFEVQFKKARPPYLWKTILNVRIHNIIINIIATVCPWNLHMLICFELEMCFMSLDNRIVSRKSLNRNH